MKLQLSTQPRRPAGSARPGPFDSIQITIIPQ